MIQQETTKKKSIFSRIPKIIGKLLFIKLPFRLMRIVLYIISIATLTFFIWSIFWLFKIELSAKKLRKELAKEYDEIVTSLNKSKYRAALKKYQVEIEKLERAALKLKKEAKIWNNFKYQFCLQQARFKQTMVVEYKIFCSELQNIEFDDRYLIKNSHLLAQKTIAA